MPIDDEFAPAPHGSTEAPISENYHRDEQQEITRLAYQFYLDRLGGHGSAHEDWVRAEQQVRASRVSMSPVEASPTKAVAVESIPVETAAVRPVPVEPYPVEALPVKAIPVEAVAVEPAEAVPVASPSKTVVGVFDQVDDAKRVVSALESAGFPRDEISIIAKKDSNSDPSTLSADVTGASASGSHLATDAGIGAALGGVGGLLLSVAGLAIPGIGPVLALGPILAALSGAGLGAMAGGIIGALTGSGVPEEDAQYYAEGVRRGHCLVTVRTKEDSAERVRDIMDQNGALDVEGRVKNWRDRGWDRHQSDAEPLSADELRREREYYSAAGKQASEWDREGRQAEPAETATLDAPVAAETGTPLYGDSTEAAFRKPDRATAKVEQGIDRAMESAAQSARRLGSRIYDIQKR